MKIVETELPGVFDLSMEAHKDARGLFARTFCSGEFTAAGIDFAIAQANLSRNDAAYTLRGMHWQDPPFAEAKVVRVTAGAVYDVVVDLRPGPTCRRWIARTLDAEAGDALFIPEGCAHGFLTLNRRVDIFYLMGKSFQPGHARGFRWDDPAIGISWPRHPAVISDADRTWPALPIG